MRKTFLTPEQHELYLSILDEYEKYRSLSNDEKENLILQITSTPFINLLCDWAFKHVFGNNKQNLMMLLNDFLPEEVIDIEYDPNETDPLKGDDKQIIMDVMCHTKTGKFLVEMQRSEKEGFRNRMAYYGAGSIFKQLKKGDPYQKLVPVYVICFMNFCLSHSTNQLVYHYQIREQESGEFYGNQLSIVLCELPRFILEPDRKLSPVEEWFEILRNMSNFTARPAHVNKRFDPIFEASRQTRLVELEQQQYFRAMLTEEEKQDIATAYLKRGREEGLREGFEKGMEKGIEQGMAEGHREASRIHAMKLLERKVDIDTIVFVTGLSKEEVIQLQLQV